MSNHTPPNADAPDPAGHDSTMSGSTASDSTRSDSAASDSPRYQMPQYQAPYFHPSGSQEQRPNGPHGPHGAAQNQHNFFSWLRNLGITRGESRWLGGVCSGVAARFGIDPIIVRGAFFVFPLLFGVGLLIYAAAWALLPEPDGRIHVEEVGRGYWSSGMTGATIMAGISLSTLWRGIAFSGFGWGVPWWATWVILIAGAVVAVVLLSSRGTQPSTTTPPPSAAFGQPDSATSATEAAAESANSAEGIPTAPLPNHDQPSPGQSLSHQPLRAHGFAAQQPATIPNRPSPAGYRPNLQPSAAAWAAARSATPKTTTPKPLGAGAAPLAIILGLAALAAAAVVLLHLLLGWFDTNIALIAWAAAGVVLGLGIIVLALRGRNDGPLGFLAIVCIVAAAVSPIVSESSRWAVATSLSDAPSRADGYPNGISVAAGKLTLDLTHTQPGSKPLAVRFAAGSAAITLPSDRPVQVTPHMIAATVSVNNTTDKNSNLRFNAGSPGEPLIVEVYGTAGSLALTVDDSASRNRS